MPQPAPDRIHALELPLTSFSLLIPSASTAEVVNLPHLTAVPLGAPWLLGVMGWRTLAVPVISYELLMGARTYPAPSAASKAVIFFPLPGRKEWEFFGILAAAEPRPQTVVASLAIPVDAGELPDSPYVASGLRIGGKVVAIPDMAVLRKAFYP